MNLRFHVCLLTACGIAGMAAAQPANDNFVNRLLLEGGTAAVGTSLAGATLETGEPVLTGISSGQTAWWTWTAPSNGIVTLSVAATNFSPALAVYTGNDLASLSLMASNVYLTRYENAECGYHWRYRNETTFHAAAGVSYQIAIDSGVVTDSSWVRTNGPIAQPPYIPPHLVLTNHPIHVWTNDWPVPATNSRQYYPIYPIDPYYPSSWTVLRVTNAFAGAEYSLGLNFVPAPANDDFAASTALAGSRVHVTANNAGATEQPGEPDHLGNPGGSSVWYAWTAPASGRVTLSTNEMPPYTGPFWWGSSRDAVMLGRWFDTPTCGALIDQNPPPVFYPLFAVYTGAAVDVLTPAGCLPLGMPEFPHAITFDAVGGQTYGIAFDGNRGTTGTVPMFLSLTTPAANDDFRNRIRVSGIYVVATGYNAGATREEGEPGPFMGETGKSVWWTWTAPVSGVVTIDLAGSDFLFPVAVFAGDKLENLICVSAGYDASFIATEGETYQIAVSDSFGRTGAIRLRLQAPVVVLECLQVKAPRNGKVAVLTFASLPGHKVALQRSADGETWQDVRKVTSRGRKATFVVRPAPGPSGPFYRAIIVD